MSRSSPGGPLPLRSLRDDALRAQIGRGFTPSGTLLAGAQAIRVRVLSHFGAASCSAVHE